MALNNPYSISLDGVDDYIRIPSNRNFLSDPSLTGQLTVEFWARIKSGYYIISSGSHMTSYRGISISYENGDPIIHLADGAKLWTINGAHMISNEWHHYALVWDGITLTWLVDGEQKNQVTGTSHSRTNKSTYADIGKPINAYDYYCKFDLDELRVWDHARDLELIKHYKDQKLGPEKPGPAIYYSFDSDSGNIAYDLGPSAIDATVYGATWIPSEINLSLCPLKLGIVSDFRAKAHIGPKVETLPATDIGSKSMTLNGKLKGIANYAGAECSFQYYPVDQYQNKALNFNGEGHIRIPYAPCLSPETITIEAFIKPSKLSGPQTILSQEYQEFYLSDYNTIIYVDAEKGNDLTGNGTKEFPFQTLTEAIKHHNGPTAFIMGKGIYNSVNVNSAEYQEKLAFIGQGKDTIFKITGTLTRSGEAGPLRANLYFYDLVWEGNNLGGTNYMALGQSSWYFYNIVFKNIPNCNYGYFAATQTDCTLSFENCIKVSPSGNFIRHSNDAQKGRNVLIKNCYGAWNDLGSNTTEAHLDVVTSIRTNTPSLDENYNILEEGWQNAGTGTNPDGTRAHIGVYGGPYAWDYLSYFLKLADSRVEFGCMTDSVSRLFSQYEISEGETIHVACTYDKIGMKIYINGNLDSFMPKNGNLLAFSAPLYIAKNFNGTIDEIRIWDHARTQKEIEEYITQELTGAEEGLIAYYRFNEGEGDIIYDCSANYNDGTIDKAQWVDSPFKLMPPKEKLEITEIPIQLPDEAGTIFDDSSFTFEFSDDFDRSTLGPDWEIAPGTQGSVQLQNGELVLTGGSSRRMWVRTTRTFEARSIVFRARRDSADAWSDVGLAFNWDGNLGTSGSGEPLNGYRLSWAVWENPSKLKITRYDNWVNTDLNSIEFPPDNNEHEFAILIEDGVIRVFVDGVQMLQANDSTYTSGYIGLTATQDSTDANRRGRYNWIVVNGTKKEKVLMPTPLRETPSQKIYSPYTLVKTVTPKEVNGLYFDGVNDRVTIPHNALLKPTRITLMAWVEKDDWADNDINNSKIISCTQTSGYSLQVNRDSGTVGILAYIGGAYRTAYAPKPASGKHFICGTYDGKYLRTYIDGELAKETAYSGSISYSYNNAVMIGAEPDSGSNAQAGYYFKGKISNVSIWNRAITAEEVKYYYENGLKGNEHGLVAYYKIDEGESNKVYNSSLYKSEYNLDGTISGATWDIVSLPETKYEYKPGVKFSSIITPGEYKPISGVIKGLRFDGVDDYVLFGNDSIFRSNLTSVTIEAIIKPEKVSGTSFIFDVGFYADKGYGLSIDNSFWFRTPTAYGGASLRSTTNINTGSIYYVTCVLDGESDLMKIYINGVLEGQVAVSPSLVLNSTTVTTDKARIGSQAKESYRSERFFKGELYQFRFWNRALSDEEIALYYNKRITQDFPGLVINYSFDKDIGGNVLVDSSPSYNHGAIYGAQRINADVPLYSIDREPSGTRYYYRAVAKGLPDYALVFNGTSSYATTGIDTLALQDLFDISIDFIAYDFNSLDSIGNRLITALRQDGAYTRWAIGAQDGKIAFLCRLVDSPENLQQTGSVLQKNTLYNVRVVYDGSLTKIYLNGVLDIEINGRIVSDSYGKIALGILPPGTGELKRYWFGEIRKVSFWNRIRIDDEVAINNSIIVGNEPGLVAYYRMVEGEGDTLVDHSINQNHGTIYGATWKQL